MLFGWDLQLFFDDINSFYEALPSEGKLILYVILILIFMAIILIIIMLEQKRLNKNIVVNEDRVSENTEVLDLGLGDSIDENNEKTRNLKEITDKIQAAIDNKAIDLTKFEQDQEETSIISYEELKKSVGQKEEPIEEPFSLPNLVHKIEVDEQIEKEQPFAAPKPKEEKFKSSVFISPVFGIQESNASKIKKEEPVAPPKSDITPTLSNFKEEETFLTNLRNFRKNLE